MIPFTQSLCRDDRRPVSPSYALTMAHEVAARQLKPAMYGSWTLKISSTILRI